MAEQEANADGYVTTQTGESGTIPAGGTAEASFINRKDPPGGGIVKTGDGANPVSYTHLDVYKRQLYHPAFAQYPV